ncbi:MAG: 4-hydroxythreonine-4-phosphate dehydrogenase PdxA [Alphaproteobacteria bacterium]|nr:4-hydroxythreonine-4-phosphate dehydrogenase PdxA [Alphaproteobacteria bacterium]
MQSPKPLAITMGDPAGIAGEITLMAWRARREKNLPPFFLLDDPARIERLAQDVGLDAPVRLVQSAAEAASAFPRALPVLPVALPAPVKLGEPNAKNAPAVIAAIDKAVALMRRGEAAAVVTNPIHKHSLYAAGFKAPGHTEYLAQLAGPGVRPVMMLACPTLRVVPVTVHVPLRDAVAKLNTDDIVASGEITARALAQDFGIARPRLAVAGINPHAGEDGSIGDEERRIIAPAVERLRRAGIAVTGPLPPDGMFHDEARTRYDAAICMYHDQALIPLKALGFWDGINVTLGLPFVRTSPDHGTAFELAGRGMARPESLIAAIAAAAEFARRRGIDGESTVAHRSVA